MLQRAAIIDLGTNTFHLLVIEWEGSHYKVLDKLQLPVKLGKGAFHDKQIKEDAYSRGIAAMIEFKGLIDSYNISIVEAYGTSAMRNARNADAFRKEAETILGHPIKIINGRQEAEYIYNGVKHAVPLGDEPQLIMDIGGGSVEFIIADSNYIHWAKSFEIGAARLIEQYYLNDPIDHDSVVALEDYLEKELSVLWIKGAKYQIKSMVGASGSFESIAGIEMEMYHSTSQVFPFLHHIIDMNHYEAIHQRILRSTKDELAKLPGLPAFRVDMIVVALVMINYVVKRLKIRKIIASDYALKEGVMFKIMKEAVATDI